MSVEMTRGQMYKIRYKYETHNGRHQAEMTAVYLGPDGVNDGEAFSLRPVGGTVVIQARDLVETEATPGAPAQLPNKVSFR